MSAGHTPGPQSGWFGSAPGTSYFLPPGPSPCSRSQPLTSQLLCCSTRASSTTATKNFHTGWASWHRNMGAGQCLFPAKGTREGKFGLSTAAAISACFLLPVAFWQGSWAPSTFSALLTARGTGRLIWSVAGDQGTPVTRSVLSNSLSLLVLCRSYPQIIAPIILSASLSNVNVSVQLGDTPPFALGFNSISAGTGWHVLPRVCVRPGAVTLAWLCLGCPCLGTAVCAAVSPAGTHPPLCPQTTSTCDRRVCIREPCWPWTTSAGVWATTRTSSVPRIPPTCTCGEKPSSSTPSTCR